MDDGQRLCAACGLCCNGVLFADVELQPRDIPERLEFLGLRILAKGRGDLRRFRQPCPAWEGCRCAIYRERPSHCRAFDCRQLRRLKAGDTSESEALDVIRRTLRQVVRVEDLLQVFGQTRRDRPLAARYAAAMRRAVDLAGDPQAAARQGRLLRAMRALMRRLETDFR
jgi:hypothetical protein